MKRREFTKRAFLFATIAGSAASLFASEAFNSVIYQNQRFQVARSYRDFDEYKDDPNNLPTASVHAIEALMSKAKFGPEFANAKALSTALSGLQFPGYGFFYANQLGARIDPALELVYVEIPGRRFYRYIALEKQAAGSLRVAEDFIAPQEPEITRVHRSSSGALEYTKANGQVVVPLRHNVP